MAFEEIEETDEYEEIYKVAPYYGDNGRIRSEIVNVLLEVPEQVANFACQRCIFISINGEYDGRCHELDVPPGPLVRPHAFWLIELSETICCARSFRYRKYAQALFRYNIAHELAHAYLDHQEVSSEDEAEREAEANRLAMQWGFVDPCTARREREGAEKRYPSEGGYVPT